MLSALILSTILSATSSYSVACELGTCVETITTEIKYVSGTTQTIKTETVTETPIDLRN
jgi:hypothetical protein